MTTSRFTTNNDIFSGGVLGAPLRPSLALNFAKSGSGDSRLTTVRSGSTGTVFGRNGNIQTISPNSQRISYSPYTGECLGLLVEDTRVNVVQNTNNGGYASTGTARAPDGSTAYKAIPTGNVTFAGVGDITQQGFALSTAVGQTTDYSFSGYFSSFGPLAYKPFIVIRSWINGSSGTENYALLWLDPINGTTGGKFLGTGWSEVNAPYVALHPCGMYYISWTVRYTQPATTRNRVDCYLQILNEANQQTYTADGVSGFQFACMQFEQGNGATSYIPTTNASATRNFDDISYPVGDWFNPVEGTLLVEYTHGEKSEDSRIASIQTSTSDRISLLASNSTFTSGPFAAVTSGGVSSALLTDRAPILRSKRLVALSYKENDFRFCDSGRPIKSDTLGPVPTVTNLYVGSHGLTGVALNGYLAKFFYFPKTFTDNELIMITT